MGLLSKLKSALGMGDTDRRSTHDTTVPVEREREVESEPPADRTTAEQRSSSRTGTTGGPETPGVTDNSSMDTQPTEPSGGSTTATPEEPTGEPVDSIKGIGPAYSQQLEEAGIQTTDQLAGADASVLAGETGIPESRIQEWIDRARAP